MYTEAELNDLRTKVLANRSARERGEPEPFNIDSTVLRACVEQIQTSGRISAAAEPTKASRKKEDKVEAGDPTLAGW